MGILQKTKLSYNASWTYNRLNYIFSLYPETYFEGKTVLELGSYNGDIGMIFQNIGAKVVSVEGKHANVKRIHEKWLFLNVREYNLDTDEWPWGHFDVIINFGLFYHLRNHHKDHLLNCVNNSDLLFLESVIYDSPDDELYIRKESGADQAISSMLENAQNGGLGNDDYEITTAGTPTRSFVENILSSTNSKWSIHNDIMSGDGHFYDWCENNNKTYHDKSRRFWIIENTK